MSQSMQNALIFLAAGTAGMLGHYLKAWVKNEITGNLVDYLFRDNPRATVAAFGGVLAATFTAWSTNTLDGLSLQALLALGFTTGFSMDSTLNKGGSPSVIGAQLPRQKQGGFSAIGALVLLAFASVVMLMLVSCSATPARLAYDADLAADQGYKSVASLLRAHAIDVVTAQRIVAACDAVASAAGVVQVCAAANGDDPARCSTATLNEALSALSQVMPHGAQP